MFNIIVNRKIRNCYSPVMRRFTVNITNNRSRREDIAALLLLVAKKEVVITIAQSKV